MTRKIFDIFPPKELEKKEEKEIFIPKPPRFKFKKPKIRALFSFKSKFCTKLLVWGKKNLVLVPLILILAFLSCYFTLSKAEIEIWPETQILTFKTKITIDGKADQPNFSAKIIPGKIFEEEKSISESFPSSGKILKEVKAEGIIRVYNAYSTYSQVLVATTRFVSADGKLFRSIERVTIPGGEYVEGKFIPGYLDIKVRADQPGPEYNIGPTTFSIPGFAGTARYTAFYGKSFEPMKGGFKEEVPQVTQKDLDQAKDILVERAREECEVSLKDKIPSEFDLLKEAIDSKILETFSLARAGQELETFSFQVKVKSKALVFNSEDIENFAIDFISTQIPSDSNQKLHSESLKINYFPESLNLESGKITLSLEMEAKLFADIAEIYLKKGLVGKSLNETKIFLENQPEITEVQVELWPFWVKRVPEDIKKIEIKLNLD